jgi:hypothetical protein
MPRFKVRVYHNLDARFAPYRQGHRLALAYECEQASVLMTQAPYQLFDLFNIGDDPRFGTPDPRALAYRARGNRSLSVGDVLALTDSAGGWIHFTVTATGFRTIHPPHPATLTGSDAR